MCSQVTLFSDFGRKSQGLPRGVALSLCRVFVRDDVAELTVVAVVLLARANVAVAL